MRNVKLKGRKLLNADYIHPDIVIAEFNNDYCKQSRRDIVNELNYGSRMLDIYEQHRDNMYIANVVEMLKLMEDVYSGYIYERYENRIER
ncbi:hypothetical protein EOL73_00230 [Candidatus Saccharibacteria bacterium]|nr:hypothetical protein [Candidatus Saccharibacteria bacterium]